MLYSDEFEISFLNENEPHFGQLSGAFGKSFTSPTLRKKLIPLSIWKSIWQCSIQTPGLFAIKRKTVNPASGTATVSLIGGLLKFLFILPSWSIFLIKSAVIGPSGLSI